MITSPANPTLKQIRVLSQRKAREAAGLFFVEGIRLVTAAVEAGAEIESCVWAPALLRSQVGQETVLRLEGQGIPCIEVSPRGFESLSRREGPRGIGVLVRQNWQALDTMRLDDGLGLVALEGVQNPGNLGTILRTCDAVGGKGVVLIGDTTDPYDPSAVRASMGAIFTQNLMRAALPDLEVWRRTQCAPLIGTSDAANVDYTATRYQPPLVLLMGSEQKGLSPEALRLCDQVVRIPMVGDSDSLNLAVATGVALYEIFNQTRKD